jgi:hypothetical protein
MTMYLKIANVRCSEVGRLPCVQLFPGRLWDLERLVLAFDFKRTADLQIC